MASTLVVALTTADTARWRRHHGPLGGPPRSMVSSYADTGCQNNTTVRTAKTPAAYDMRSASSWVQTIGRDT
ncbi:MAG TPA: hypothetical protein VFR23_17415 [Jiangellaceae bacterium]|nr:hypothetical protein [Jiangellaceae bacterium]